MKTLIQGGYVVGFDGREHEIIKDGVVVFDGDRIEYVGKQYSQPVDKTIEAKGCLVSRLHRHPFSLWDQCQRLHSQRFNEDRFLPPTI